MKKLKHHILHFILFVLSITGYAFSSGQIPDDINVAIRNGNAGQLAKYFNNSIELKIIETGDIFAKAQAEIMLKNFFAKNKPVSFTIIQEGKSTDSRFSIGKLTTNQNKKFIVYFLIQDFKGVPYITQFKIENE